MIVFKYDFNLKSVKKVNWQQIMFLINFWCCYVVKANAHK
jgi:hypothetical protein